LSVVRLWRSRNEEESTMTLNLTENLNVKTHGEIAVMDATGDTKVIWSRDNADEVEVAREQFKQFKAKGFTAFKVRGKDGERGDQIDEFDPNAERIIFVPAMRGG
jgi:DNA polymerase IIIc chi subunit